MSGCDVREVARHSDRMSRRVAISRGESNIPPRELCKGWMSAEAVGDGGEFASNCQNRVQFVGLDGPVPDGAIAEAVAAFRDLGKQRAFFRLGPRAWDARVHTTLELAGAREIAWVRYPVLVRAAGEAVADAATVFEVRVVPRGESRDVMAATAPWFSEAGVRTAVRLIDDGKAELHAAFEGPRPVSVGLLMMDGAWGYLGFAGTAPECRGKGGQSAIIRSRVLRARELGAAWCTSETATAVMTSLNNLVRLGFREAFGIRVYGWQADPA